VKKSGAACTPRPSVGFHISFSSSNVQKAPSPRGSRNFAGITMSFFFYSYHKVPAVESVLCWHIAPTPTKYPTLSRKEISRRAGQSAANRARCSRRAPGLTWWHGTCTRNAGQGALLPQPKAAEQKTLHQRLGRFIGVPRKKKKQGKPRQFPFPTPWFWCVDAIAALPTQRSNLSRLATQRAEKTGLQSPALPWG